MKRHAKIAKILSAVWLGAYLGFGLPLSLTYGLNVELKNLPPAMQWISFFVVLLLLYPLLWIIRHHAKHGQLKHLLVVVYILLFAFSAWILAAILSFLQR